VPQPQALTELSSNFRYTAVLEHWCGEKVYMLQELELVFQSHMVSKSWLIFMWVILILDARVCVQYGVPGRYTDAVFELLVHEQSVIWTNPSTCT